MLKKCNIICITNQPGIAKGFLKIDKLNKIHEYINFLINKRLNNFLINFILSSLSCFRI